MCIYLERLKSMLIRMGVCLLVGFIVWFAFGFYHHEGLSEGGATYLRDFGFYVWDYGSMKDLGLYIILALRLFRDNTLWFILVVSYIPFLIWSVIVFKNEDFDYGDGSDEEFKPLRTGTLTFYGTASGAVAFFGAAKLAVGFINAVIIFVRFLFRVLYSVCFVPVFSVYILIMTPIDVLRHGLQGHTVYVLDKIMCIVIQIATGAILVYCFLQPVFELKKSEAG